MDGAAIAPPKQVAQWHWLALTIVLGMAGSLSALIGFGSGTYSIGPLVVELSTRPSVSGTTQLAIQPAIGLTTGHAEATTHTGFLSIRGTVVNVHGQALLGQASQLTKDPQTLATYIKDEGKQAGQEFAVKVGLMALAGGAGGGAIIGLIGLRPRRLFQGALAGLLLVGLLGFVGYQTYDTSAFRNTQFKPGVAFDK